MDTQHCQDRCSPPCHISFSHSPYFIISIAAAITLHAAAIFLFVGIFTLKPSLSKKPQIYSISIFSLKERPKQTTTKNIDKPKTLKAKKTDQKKHKTHLKEKTRVKEKPIKKHVRGFTHKLHKYKKIENIKEPLEYAKKEKIPTNFIVPHEKACKKEQISHKEGSSGKETKNLKGKNKIKSKKIIFLSEDGYPSIYSWIASHKFYPLEALFKNEQGSVTAEFTINPDGIITNIKISKGSFNSLNNATVKIIRNSSPIPKKILAHSNLKLPATVIVKLIYKING